MSIFGLRSAAAKPDHGALEAARHGVARSSRWPRVEKAHLAAHPHCAACNPGTNLSAGLQAHHIFPFELEPERPARPVEAGWGVRPNPVGRHEKSLRNLRKNL